MQRDRQLTSRDEAGAGGDSVTSCHVTISDASMPREHAGRISTEPPEVVGVTPASGGVSEVRSESGQFAVPDRRCDYAQLHLRQR